MANTGPGSGQGLLTYFKLCWKDSYQITLPNSTDPLCKKADDTTTEEANKKVTAVIAAIDGKFKPYSEVNRQAAV